MQGRSSKRLNTILGFLFVCLLDPSCLKPLECLLPITISSVFRAVRCSHHSPSILLAIWSACLVPKYQTSHPGKCLSQSATAVLNNSFSPCKGWSYCMSLSCFGNFETFTEWAKFKSEQTRSKGVALLLQSIHYILFWAFQCVLRAEAFVRSKGRASLFWRLWIFNSKCRQYVWAPCVYMMRMCLQCAAFLLVTSMPF